jgi:response regulator RpfG family c-di-GMP phosphodiesterase
MTEKKSILIIDDEPDELLWMKEKLSQGYPKTGLL